MQPAREQRALRELGGIFCQRDEHPLRHVVGEVRIANHSPRSGIDEIHVTAHEFGKRGFAAPLRVGAQQLGVRLVVHSSNSSRSVSNTAGSQYGCKCEISDGNWSSFAEAYLLRAT